MDEKTSQYYRSHAAELTKRYDAVVSSVSRYFRVAFTEGARLLDVGAGSGRDMAMLQSMGYDVYGVEPCDEMLAQAEANHPELASRLAIGQLPDLGKPFGGDFDGILCSAVLMHLPREAIFDAAFAMRSALKDGGTILMSVPLSRPGYRQPAPRRPRQALHRSAAGLFGSAVRTDRLRSCWSVDIR